MKIDRQVSIKLLMKLWGPRLEFVVRLMLIATFLEDSLRSATHFSGNIEQVSTQGYLTSWLVEKSPILVGVFATVVMSIGLVAQLLGSLCLLTLKHVDCATQALIAWTIAQPVLFAQLSNIEFIAESLTVIGGLLMLQQAKGSAGASTQLLGRVLLPMVYLYDAGHFLSTAFTLDETNNVGMFFSSLSIFFVKIAVLVGLLIGSTLVGFGLKSRTVALLLALVNLGFVFYLHPFFLYIWFEDGELKVNDYIPMPTATTPEGTMAGDFDAWTRFDLHRYYFFLGLSTSGALLLLAQFGPGDIAIQKDEVLLPYLQDAQQKAQD